MADTSRPDIAYAVNQLARKMANPRKVDWDRAKHVLRYLVGTSNFGTNFPYGNTGKQLVAYCDSDFAGDLTTIKSTTGWLLMFNNSMFHWRTQLQRRVSLSSTESEIIAMCSTTKELAWIRRMLIELQMLDETPAKLLCDNQSAIRVVQSERATARTRHLRAQNSYDLEQIELNELEVGHVKSIDQLADLLTKAMATCKLKEIVAKIMTKCNADVSYTSCVQADKCENEKRTSPPSNVSGRILASVNTLHV